jgi:hypothetical protein
MPVRFRPWDPGRRFLCPLPARGPSHTRWRWIALHREPPPWRDLFGRALALLGVGAVPVPGGLAIGSGAGRIAWRGSRRWSVVTLELTGFSARKRALVAAALVKVARYS